MNAPLHLARVTLDEARLAAFAAATGTLDDDGGYALHLALRRRFGAAAPQPFRVLCDRRGAHLLGYVADPAALRAAEASSILPDPTGDWDAPDPGPIFVGPWAFKPMPSTWTAGDRYGFEVLVRPVRRRGPSVRAAIRAEGAATPGAERDAFLAAVLPHHKGDDHGRTRASVYTEWLAERMSRRPDATGGCLAPIAAIEWPGTEGGLLEPGRRLPPQSDPAVLASFRRTRLVRRNHVRSGDTTRIEGPEALMRGTLRVVDPERFAGLLAHGVGRHAAFGFGMLLLRPPGP
jgi:CRISPR system Cascade subunit CasE